ncbi:FliA/WhiG family RNA polymerase sigma factor [Microaerobacter geothermalis]|nr:FliA/WhiG family RNA polymerase sigma factor [Microaerobacter geothermalis]
MYDKNQSIQYYGEWVKWKKHDNKEAEDFLVNKYLPLVDYVVNRLAITMPKTIQRDELRSLGILGLLDAMKKYDYSRGLQFETYAMWRIRGNILDGIRENDWIPRSMREKLKKVEEAYTVLEQEKLRSVTDKEVSDFLGISEDELLHILSHSSMGTLLSLDEPISEEDQHQTSLQSTISDPNVESPERRAEWLGLKEVLSKTIDRLPEKEKLVISLFYYDELTLTEIAEVMGLSTSRISQLHSKAIYRMRAALEKLKSHLL